MKIVSIGIGLEEPGDSLHWRISSATAFSQSWIGGSDDRVTAKSQ
jgi:hypothetical protein